MSWEQLTLWSEGALAKASVQQEKERDLKIQEGSSCSSTFAWLEQYARNGSSGRMYQVSYPVTTGEPLEPSSGKWPTSGIVSAGDAQHFGVPQRRRRVFLVGHLGADRECAAKVLFDPYCLSRNFAKSTQKKKKAATNDGSCLASGNQTAGTILGEHGRLQFADNQSAFTANFHVLENVDRLQLSRLNHHIINGRQDPITSSVAQPLTTDTSGLDNVFCDVYNGSVSDVAPTMTTATGITNGSGPKLLQTPYTQSGFASYSQGFGTLTATDHKRPEQHIAATHDNIRRLTPVECERLQGFPDNHTRIKWRGKDENKCPDGHRYKALGNSMAVPVMRWIGHNINQYDERYYLPW